MPTHLKALHYRVLGELQLKQTSNRLGICGSTMSYSGNRIFRSALLIESAANISSIFPMLINPEYTLSWVVRGPAQITPAAKALTQWIAAFLVIATVPLLLSYPESGSGESASNVTARRRLTYTLMGAGEAALGLVTLSQYMAGDSGLTDQALLTATGMMGVFGAMRLFFLYGRPQWMEGQAELKKSQ